jgi:hypothetical protein
MVDVGILDHGGQGSLGVARGELASDVFLPELVQRRLSFLWHDSKVAYANDSTALAQPAAVQECGQSNRARGAAPTLPEFGVFVLSKAAS